MSKPGSSRLWILVLWQIAAVAVFVLVGGMAAGLPFWLLTTEAGHHLQTMVLAFLASAAVPVVMLLSGHKSRVLYIVLWTALAFVLPIALPFLHGMLLKENTPHTGWLESPVPGTLALMMVVAAALLNAYLVRQRGIRMKHVVSLAAIALALAVLSLPVTRSALWYRHLERPVTRLLDTNKYAVTLNVFREHLPGPRLNGGGLEVVDGTVLLVTGDGLLYSLDFSADGSRMKARALGVQVPINIEAFRARVTGTRPRTRFRTWDMLWLGGPSQGQLLISHHVLNTEEDCFQLRISAMASSVTALLDGAAENTWRTLYESQPCMPVRTQGKDFFAGHQSGGRMVRAGPGHILLSLGDFGFDGIQRHQLVSQDDESHYGKIVEIDVQTGEVTLFASGLRNSQGLHVDAAGRIWSTDQGPRGGDELNLIQQGNNYGWPYISLGTRYSKQPWPALPAMQPEVEFEPPVFAWIPSIGISNLITVDDGVFANWRGDLLVSSLHAQVIHRVRLEGNHVLLVEPIGVHNRVRDIALDQTGRVILWMDWGSVGLMQPAEDISN